MSRNDYNWLMARKSFTNKQTEEMEKYGFTYLSSEQQNLVYRDTGDPLIRLTTKEL